jgi:hypothetical protein
VRLSGTFTSIYSKHGNFPDLNIKYPSFAMFLIVLMHKPLPGRAKFVIKLLQQLNVKNLENIRSAEMQRSLKEKDIFE